MQNSKSHKEYKLSIVRRFEFSSKHQSMSVIVKNNLDHKYRYFIKGAPEKIIEFCKLDTLPINYIEKLSELTQNGLRVLACATKTLPDEDYRGNEVKRSNFDNNLTFLGLIIFKNELKTDTKLFIKKLRFGNCKLVISTGDNPFTSISVATEATIIKPHNNIYICDIDDGPKTNKYHNLKW